MLSIFYCSWEKIKEQNRQGSWRGTDLGESTEHTIPESHAASSSLVRLRLSQGIKNTSKATGHVHCYLFPKLSLFAGLTMPRGSAMRPRIPTPRHPRLELWVEAPWGADWCLWWPWQSPSRGRPANPSSCPPPPSSRSRGAEGRVLTSPRPVLEGHLRSALLSGHHLQWPSRPRPWAAQAPLLLDSSLVLVTTSCITVSAVDHLTWPAPDTWRPSVDIWHLFAEFTPLSV